MKTIKNIGYILIFAAFVIVMICIKYTVYKQRFPNAEWWTFLFN